MNSYSVLILLQLPKFKRKTVEKILNEYTEIPTSAPLLKDFLNELLKNDIRTNVPSYESIKLAISDAKKIIQKCSNSGISIMNYSEYIFPKKLKAIPYPPLLLYYKGCIKYLNEEYCAAVIGTRLPSERGKFISQKIGSMFALKGFTVVSGLAIGCDTYGHLGSLERCGNNISVLPCSLDNIYPHENINLVNKIISSGGCLISEYPPNTNPRPQYFILRDRLVSGLVSVVSVIETNLNGGTMHTAKFALDQDKILLCISPTFLGEACSSNKGNMRLIGNNMAIPLNDFQDLEHIIEGILNSSLKPIFNIKIKEAVKYEQLKMNI